MFFLLSFIFFSTKRENKRAEQVLPRDRGGGEGGEEVAQIMYTQISKCKNNKA
jgi:hypothetical protein